MSIVAFKKKSVIQYGSNRSGKSSTTKWLPQGPFGKNTLVLEESIQNQNSNGFSLNGGHRNIGYIGKTSMFSKQGTRFRGTQPYGCGGSGGRYPQPLPFFNVNEVIVLADQEYFVKPSVLSTYGMLAKKYRWIRGQYPNNWVQPNYPSGTQSDSASQGVYIHDKTVANICVSDVNNSNKYIGHIVKHGPTLCRTSTARFKFDDMVRNGPYTKELYQPNPSSEQTLRVQRKCINQNPNQKPFPFAVPGVPVTHLTNITKNSCLVNTTDQTYLAPPLWYTTSPNGLN